MDYFDRVEAELSGRLRAGAGTVDRRRRALVPLFVSVVLVIAVGAVLLSTRGATRPGARTSGVPAISPPPGRRHADPGLSVPATYGQGCDQSAHHCNGVSTLVPSVLRDRPMELGLPTSGGRCPASHGTRVSNSLIGGIALGGAGDTVRPLIANGGDLRHGQTILGTSGQPGWGAVDVVWFSIRAYRGPFVIRVTPLLHSGVARLGDGLPVPPPAPLMIPPGDTLNTGTSGTGLGIRAVPSALWVRHPGCYEMQVDGLRFTDDYVLHVLPVARRR